MRQVISVKNSGCKCDPIFLLESCGLCRFSREWSPILLSWRSWARLPAVLNMHRESQSVTSALSIQTSALSFHFPYGPLSSIVFGTLQCLSASPSPENISSVFQDAGQQSHHTVPCSWDMNLGNLTASKSGYFPCTSIRILTQVSALILEPWMFNRVNQSVTQLSPLPTWDSVISGLLNQLPLSNLLTNLPILLFIFFFSCPDMFFPLKKSFCCFKGGFGV